jgi:hypothetical protein
MESFFAESGRGLSRRIINLPAAGLEFLSQAFRRVNEKLGNACNAAVTELTPTLAKFTPGLGSRRICAT